MLEMFSKDGIFEKNIKFKIIGFNGEVEAGEGVGVSKEVISSFFDEIYTSFCCGAQDLVPILRHDMQRQQWDAVARVIIYGISLKYFPIKISKPFMISTFFDENSIEEKELINSFLNYVSTDEKEIIQNAVDNFPEDREDLIEVLSSYNCKSNPSSSDSFKLILAQLAHQEIIQKPKYVASCWHEIFQKFNYPPSFDIGCFYKNAIPTGRKVSLMLKVQDVISPEEQAVFEHLKRFVKNLSPENLKKFLKLCTGADIITVERIGVDFNSMIGLQRRPVFRTCGAIIEVPNTYSCFSELAEEFQNIINGSMRFDIA